jgi:hypothetical protein
VAQGEAGARLDGWPEVFPNQALHWLQMIGRCGPQALEAAFALAAAARFAAVIRALGAEGKALRTSSDTESPMAWPRVLTT